MRLKRALVILLGVASGACSAVQSPGPITFGPEENPESTFELSEDVAWSASLAQPVDETKVNIVIVPSGGDSELFGYEQFITDPDSTTLSNEMPLGRFLPNPGTYVMRSVSLDGEVLAEGEFELVADSN